MTRKTASIIDEAVHWVTRQGASNFSAADQAALDRWRQQSAEHEQMWQRAQALKQQFDAIPKGLGMSTLGRPRPLSARRQVLRTAALALFAPTLGWLAYRNLPWDMWNAEFRTAKGESRSIQLADGSRLTLNTGTSVNAVFTAESRLLRQYAGEILVETAHPADSNAPPFIVRTDEGQMQALGTRFVVRKHERHTELTVLQGAVKITPDESGDTVVVRAGERTRFDSRAIQPVTAASPEAPSWTQGILYANNMRLADFLQELARYREGVLQCDPNAADLRVSGAFQVQDTDSVLELLTQSLPVKLHERTRWWVRVARR
ncbi:FecR domain-containing protein [Diaphorobacter caeni]|uniref:FecR domain-containing protein n=1 Tax=Diaphorobacter caeni TaxID=2784387 RepID=UPI00188F26C6|nr:FecR domain-containing protein [Diaphorobacter caeni]MBF5007344.1 FecR domain-containing protein [Diaphorobacter caeni]